MAIIIDMDMPKSCYECPMCMIVRGMCAYCMAGRFQVKYSELDLRDGICPLKESSDKPIGKWEIKDKMWWVCSNCGCQTRMMKKYNVPNYCPACGAEMNKGDAE